MTQYPNRPHRRQDGRRSLALWATAALLLFAPWLAMQFTDAVTWDLADFMVFGVMLVCACGTYELATRMTGSHTYRAAAGFALATAFLLTWLTLAVGIIGSEGNPANLVYAGVILIGVIGAFIARWRPRGMALALHATALVQALVAVIVLIGGLLDAFVLSAFFAAMWLVSAQLFRRAALELA